MLIYTSTEREPMEGTPLLRLFLHRLGFTRYLMQRSLTVDAKTVEIKRNMNVIAL